MFDEALLDDPVALLVRGATLEDLAGAGARLRRQQLESVTSTVDHLRAAGADRPRAVVVLGAEARLVRSVTELNATVPLIAWPMTALPAWVGPLDLVIVLAGRDSTWLTTCREATRRGALLVVAAASDSPLLDEISSVATVVSGGDDRFVTALLMLKVLSGLGLGPVFDVSALADELDRVADLCGPRHGLGDNPAKSLACAVADTVPLLWGGSGLAARAARRVGEALRRVTGQPALAGDAEALLPLIERSAPRDVFTDPFEDDTGGANFTVLIFDDVDSEVDVGVRAQLVAAAARRRIRVEVITSASSCPVTRYSQLLQQGLYAAAYLELATIDEA
ncbi:MAG: hypothetical protein LBV00_08590 [Propionibacteriaceae bacterium]|jgi:hypothetical protein|nr:hypothetical protein [Propionibacteriaceae bacterium]